MEFQVTDAEKEKFRKYVERSGAIDQLVRGIASLYDGQQQVDSEQALELFKKQMGVNVGSDAEKLQQEHKKLKDENFKLKKLIDQMQFEIDALKEARKK